MTLYPPKQHTLKISPPMEWSVPTPVQTMTETDKALIEFAKFVIQLRQEGMLCNPDALDRIDKLIDSMFSVETKTVIEVKK